jgi:hypothetical protein
MLIYKNHPITLHHAVNVSCLNSPGFWLAKVVAATVFSGYFPFAFMHLFRSSTCTGSAAGGIHPARDPITLLAFRLRQGRYEYHRPQGYNNQLECKKLGRINVVQIECSHD